MLHICLGPMYSGKTSKLIEMFTLNPDLNKVIIDFDVDKHTKCYNGILKNHNNVQIKCIKTTTLYNNEYKFNHIYINEAQFFPDLFDFVLEQLNTSGKNIYIYGLDGDFEQKKIGCILDLIPYCDTICKLNSICKKCNKKAIFSKRITDSKEQYLPDVNSYIPVCRNCLYIV